MHINIKTFVKKSPKEVFEKFDRDLFIKLKPPGIGLKILQFDGCKEGDVVQLELNFGFFRQRWKSLITEFFQDENQIYFIDEAYGKDLPFFLKDWKHKHIISKTDNGSAIIDDINYKAPFGLNLLTYPAVYFQMLFRKPVYKKEFSDNISSEKI